MIWIDELDSKQENALLSFYRSHDDKEVTLALNSKYHLYRGLVDANKLII